MPSSPSLTHQLVRISQPGVVAASSPSRILAGKPSCSHDRVTCTSTTTAAAAVVCRYISVANMIIDKLDRGIIILAIVGAIRS